MNKKNNYEQPSAELIVVRFEENFLNSPGDGFTNQGGGGTYTEEDINDNGGY
jgi:hypothetical protein